jgi:hypothetical protein
MHGARAWMNETNGAWAERNFWPAGGGFVLMGRGEVGAEGWTPRGGGVGEREGALAWCGAARRRGIDAATARPWLARAARCRATVESGAAGSARRGRRG